MLLFERKHDRNVASLFRYHRRVVSSGFAPPSRPFCLSSVQNTSPRVSCRETNLHAVRYDLYWLETEVEISGVRWGAGAAMG